MDGLPIYLMGDQPTTCPTCGTRTALQELHDGRQLHECPRGHGRFIVEEDEDDECADCGCNLSGCDERMDNLCGPCADRLHEHEEA